MPALNEGLLASSRQLGATLQAGVDTISQGQRVTFERYVRYVLPLDGYVFWVKASLMSPSAMMDTTPFNNARFNQARVVDGPPATIVAEGSLHYATLRGQSEDGTSAVNRVVFTSEVPITDLNDIAPTDLYIATVKSYPHLPESITANPGTGSSEAGGIAIGESAVQGVVISGVSNARPATVIRFAFSRRSSFYEQAALFHYEGEAVYPDMSTQLIESVDDLNRSLVVSNSLPLWLMFNRFFPVYPSFLLPFNAQPPYAVVHIDPEQTKALQAIPELRSDPSRYSSAVGAFTIGISPIQGSALSSTSTHYQLVRDLVRVRLFGVRNQEALTWMDYVIQFMTERDNLMGLMSLTPMRDEKRGQAELGALAQRKSIEFEVSYYQTAVEAVARQLILHAVPNFIIP